MANSFPVPKFDRTSQLHQEIISLVRSLFTAEGFDQYSFDGTKVGDSTASEALEGLVSVAYGLVESDLVGILQTFHPTFNPANCTENALKSFRRFST